MESEKSGFGADINLQSLRDATRNASRSNYLVRDTLFAELAKSFAPMIEEFHHRRSTCTSSETADLEQLKAHSRDIQAIMRVMDRLSDLMSIFDNMCAHGEEVQRLLVEWKIHLAACQLLFDRELHRDLSCEAANLLIKLSSSGPHNLPIWQAIKPYFLREKLRRGLHSYTVGALATLVDNYNFPQGALADNVDSDLVAVVARVLQYMHLFEEGIFIPTHKSLNVLAQNFCFETGQLPFSKDGYLPSELHTKDRYVDPFKTNSLRAWKSAVLVTLTEALKDRASRLDERKLSGLCTSVLGLIENLARRDSIHNQRNTRLFYLATKFLRAATSPEEGLGQLAAAVLTSLVKNARLVETILSLLAALGPIKNWRPGQVGQAGLKEWPKCKKLNPKPYRAEEPYKGYRTGLVIVLADAALHRKEVQDRVQSHGGVALVLAHCQGCEESPSLQAAALRAIVNLSKGNSSIKDEIGKLRTAKAVENPSKSKQSAFMIGKRTGS